MSPDELIASLDRHFKYALTLTGSQLRQHWTHDACTDCLSPDCRGGNHTGCIGPPGDACACPCHVNQPRPSPMDVYADGKRCLDCGLWLDRAAVHHCEAGNGGEHA